MRNARESFSDYIFDTTFRGISDFVSNACLHAHCLGADTVSCFFLNFTWHGLYWKRRQLFSFIVKYSMSRGEMRYFCNLKKMSFYVLFLSIFYYNTKRIRISKHHQSNWAYFFSDSRLTFRKKILSDHKCQRHVTAWSDFHFI